MLVTLDTNNTTTTMWHITNLTRGQKIEKKTTN